MDVQSLALGGNVTTVFLWRFLGQRTVKFNLYIKTQSVPRSKHTPSQL